MRVFLARASLRPAADEDFRIPAAGFSTKLFESYRNLGTGNPRRSYLRIRHTFATGKEVLGSWSCSARFRKPVTGFARQILPNSMHTTSRHCLSNEFGYSWSHFP